MLVAHSSTTVILVVYCTVVPLGFVLCAIYHHAIFSGLLLEMPVARFLVFLANMFRSNVSITETVFIKEKASVSVRCSYQEPTTAEAAQFHFLSFRC